MEQAVLEILGGELTTDMLLLLIILGFVTKRIVPWWVYETMEQKLKEHEATAPALIEAVEELIEAIDESQGSVSPQVRQTQERLRNIERRTSTRRVPRKRPQTHD